MTLDITPLLAPISTDTPGGEDIRSSESYEAVAAEIEKMTSMSGSSPVDWGLVEQQGTQLIAQQSKDFMLAAWVSAAWMERHALDGLRAGLELHAGLVKDFWETGFPALKRLRGRRNALTWWVERAADWLENQHFEPLAQTVYDDMVAAASELDSVLGERDPESPPLGNFVRQIKNLDVIPEESAAEPTSTPAPDNSGQAAAQAAGPDAATAQAPSMATTTQGNATTRPAPAATPVSASAQSAAPRLDSGTPLNTLDDITNALTPAAQYLEQIAAALMAIDRFHPLVIEINRFAARTSILSAPSSNAGNTALMPPPVAIADAFQSVAGAGNPEGLVEFCESRIAAFPFWLDLDRESARGFGMLGERGAAMRKAVIKNVLAFTQRLPSLETLTFSDGTPFASEATRQWLDECRAQEQGGGQAADAFDAAKLSAQAAANAGQPDQAMQALQDFIGATGSGRNQLRARIALAELFMATRGDADPMPFVQTIIEDCRNHDLGAWEPDLAAQAWQTVLKASRLALSLPDNAGDAALRQRIGDIRHEALQALTRVDFMAATRFA